MWENKEKATDNSQAAAATRPHQRRLSSTLPPQNVDLMIPIFHSKNKQTDVRQTSWYLSKYYLRLVLSPPPPIHAPADDTSLPLILTV